jgi:prepilin-type N-terminal cleavage/methylation domain-containing protein
MKLNGIKKNILKIKTVAGFTLLEMMIILVIIGLLSAIVAPSWIGFHATRQLSVAQDQIQGSIKHGQHMAKLKRMPQRFVIEQYGDSVRWGIATDPNVPIAWTEFKNISIDTTQTTFRKDRTRDKRWFMVLDDDGTVTGQLGRVTLISSAVKEQRCVIMSTLLGETRKGQKHSVKRDGFSCY